MGSGVMASSSITTSPVESLPASNGSASSQKVFILSYNATTFEHLSGVESYITRPGRERPVNVEQEPMAILEIFRSEAQAKVVGKAWLYRQFEGIEIHAPCLDESEDQQVPAPGTWTRSGDRRSGWKNGEYIITDRGRINVNGEHVALGVAINEWNVNQVDNVYETDPKNEGHDEEEGSDEEEESGEEEESNEEEESDGDDMDEEDEEGNGSLLLPTDHEPAGFAAPAA